jgi:hypothetical protein
MQQSRVLGLLCPLHFHITTAAYVISSAVIDGFFGSGCATGSARDHVVGFGVDLTLPTATISH